MTPKFQFRERIPIDETHTLLQLLSRFRGVRDGLPELIKNAKDQYSRLGITDAALRTIVVVVNTDEKSIGVIDFAGATSGQFQRWETWSDPTANAREKAPDIEGGHGNGGKAFMVLGSSTDSSFESCHSGRRTRMGYDNENERMRFKPGIAVEAGMLIEDQHIESVQKQFEKALADIGLKLDQLPKQAQATFHARQSYTIAQVNGVVDWTRARDETVRRSVAELRRTVENHPQAALSLESCAVWFVVDGQVIGDTPAKVEYPDPFPGFAEPIVIPVPSEVTDRLTGDKVSTGAGDDQSRVLTLRTSARSLRTEDMRPLHLIRVRNSRNVVGLWSVADLSPGASSGFVFGELRIPSLEGDHLAGADRKSLNDTPLVRGLEAWTADRVKELADRIQQATAKEHRAEDRDKVNQSLQKLRDLMREFLSEKDRGDQGAAKGQAGAGPSGTKLPPPPPLPPRGEVVNVIELEGKAVSIAIAAGATVPLRVKAFEQTAAGELLVVPAPTLVFKTDRSDLIELDDSRQVTGKQAGTANVWFESEDGSVKSNITVIETVQCAGATISGIPDRLLLQGEHLAIKVLYATDVGNRDDLLHDASVDEIGMGRVSRNGGYVAGSREGTATLRVRWGVNQIETVSASVRIGTERVRRRGTGGDAGGDIPMILLCGTSVPGMDHYPLEQRTIMPSEHMPTIIDFDPAFENVIFINPDSRESIQARRGSRRT